LPIIFVLFDLCRPHSHTATAIYCPRSFSTPALLQPHNCCYCKQHGLSPRHEHAARAPHPLFHFRPVCPLTSRTRRISTCSHLHSTCIAPANSYPSSPTPTHPGAHRAEMHPANTLSGMCRGMAGINMRVSVMKGSIREIVVLSYHCVTAAPLACHLVFMFVYHV
jgi:hypothetical protein